MPEPSAEDKAATTPTEGKARLAHSGRVLQSAGPRAFDIVVIREGFAIGDMDGGPYMVHGHPLYWTKQGLESGVEVYEGAAVTAFLFGDTLGHLSDEQGTLKRFATLNEIGRLSNVRVEQAADGLHELRARLTLHEGVGDLVPSVLQAWTDESIPQSERGGFSIEALADFLPGVIDGKAVTQGVRIRRNPDGTSLDMVSHPAAGGRVLKVAASIRGTATKENPKMSESATAAAEAEALKIKQAAEAEAEKVRLALKAELDAAQKANKEIAESARLGRIERTASKVRQSAKDAGLSDKGVGLVSDFFDGAESVEDAALKAKVEKVAQALGENRGSAGGDYAVSKMGLEPRDRIELGMEAMFTRSNEPEWAVRKVEGKTIQERCKAAGIERPQSFLRFFEEATGERFHRGFGDRKDRARVKQAISSSTFGDAFENVLNRKGVRYFESNPIFQDWRRIATIVSVPNFVKQERFVMGGYANLATVAESENFPALTTPTDEGQGYTPAKYGGVESLTRETLLRDDVNALALIPERMGNAALRTLYEFVFDLVKPSATYTMDYDGETLCDTDHDVNQNKGTTALAAAELIAACKIMQKFRDISVDKRLGVEPGIVLVPIDLGNTLHDILKPISDYPGGSTTDNSYIRQMGLQGIVVRHWTDATDWALLANPSLHPWLEVGFINGQESPQFFFQNDEGLGSMFDADKQLIKIRHEYGGAVLRHEFIYGEVVGG